MNKNREINRIKEIIKKWNQELINKLNKNENEKLEVYFIPEEWKSEGGRDLKKKLINFKNEENISKDNGDNVIPDSEFFVMGKEIFIKNLLDLKNNLISSDAEFIENKLIVDLGEDNYYFYYLNKNNDLCEGYIQSLIRGKDEEFINQFKNFTVDKFIIFIIKENKPVIKDNKVIYNLNKYKIVFKNDKELINSIEIDNNNNEKQNINRSNKIWGSSQRNGEKQKLVNNDDNEEDKKNKDLIIRCIIYYYFTIVDVNDLKSEKDKKEYNFILVDSEWIKIFREEYNYNFYEKEIKKNKIDNENYLQYLNVFKHIKTDKIKPIPSLNEIKINSMKREYTIYDNYELINPEAYELLIEYFGKEKNHKKIELYAIFFEYKYYLIKYNSKIFELIKVQNESERFLLIGKNNIDSLKEDILNNGFIKWIKNNGIIEYKVASLEITNGVMLHYLPKKINENEEDNYPENNRQPKKRNRSGKKLFSQSFENDEDEEYEENKRKKKRVGNQEEENLPYKSKTLKKNISRNSYSAQKNNRFRNQLFTYNNETYFPPIEPNGLVGLENVGATCYMNSTLQCFSNVKSLRNYFFKHKSKIKGKKLSSALLQVFENLWENSNISYFAPNKFKHVISEMNSLFEGVQANDAKDLILFILENVHNELNEINHNIEDNKQEMNCLDYNSVFKSFQIFFEKNYNSVISNTFYGMNNSMMTCCNCNRTIHNVQCFNILIFPLEEVRKYKGYDQNVVNIYDCFDYNQKQDFMTGENQISCNLCQRLSNSINQTKIIISPNVLIINLNRGRGLMYDVKLNFPEYLELKNYIYYPESPHYYELIGVICHLGTSDMSGHFISFCKNSENAKWYKFNDAIITDSNIAEALSFGVPYVLFYNYIQCG